MNQDTVLLLKIILTLCTVSSASSSRLSSSSSFFSSLINSSSSSVVLSFCNSVTSNIMAPAPMEYAVPWTRPSQPTLSHSERTSDYGKEAHTPDLLHSPGQLSVSPDKGVPPDTSAELITGCAFIGNGSHCVLFGTCSLNSSHVTAISSATNAAIKPLQPAY